MIALILNLAIATWLLLTTFLLPQSDVGAWSTMATAVVLAAVALVAFASPGRPGLRWVLTAVAVWIFAAAIVMPHESMGAVFAEIAAAVALGLVSIFPPARWLAHWREQHGGGGHAPPAAG